MKNQHFPRFPTALLRLNQEPHQLPCRIHQQDGTYFISGSLDETTDLSTLLADSNLIRINFRELTSINSLGLAKLLRLLRQRAGFGVEYHECPVLLLEHFNIIPGLLGPKLDPSIVKSGYFPYRCPSCAFEAEQELSMPSVSSGNSSYSLPIVPCPRCAVVMRPDADPSELLEFLSFLPPAERR